MGKWNCTVNIKAVMAAYEDKTDLASLKELATKLAELLKRKLNKYIDPSSNDHDMSFEEVYDRLKDHEFSDVDDFNDILNDLYDLFDAYRIWSGL